MHYHCEIVIPQTEEMESAIESVMKPFDENDDESACQFWDWYVIGGRWSGHKWKASLDQGRLAAFREWMVEEKVTVSNVTCGKETLQPASQREKVDGKWNEMFPSERFQACPLFDHAPKSLGSDTGTLADSMDIKCERIIFAGPGFDSVTKEWVGPLDATFMLCSNQWNGVNHMPVTWDGTFGDALAQFHATLGHYSESYRKAIEPQDNWLTVTVDYHT